MTRYTRRRSDGEPEPISRIINDVLATGKLGDSGQVAELWGEWKKIVGDEIAEHCFPEKINGDRLYINVDSPVWCQQLDLLKEELKEKIAEKLGNCEINKIVFRSA